METGAEETQKESIEKSQADTSSADKAAMPAPPAPHPDPPKKSKREERNRKEDEYVKQFMKAINGASTLEEKMQIAIQKYSHMVDDNKKMQFYIKQSEKRHTMLMKEKEQLQLEFNKTILVKSKLENLCRELQKQNKTIKEESLLKIREEDERRKETQAKFQNTLSEITALLQQNNEKNAKLRDDNISMTEKFKNVVTQYQLREQQLEKMAKQMALEQQLADAKLMKARLEHQAERERMLAETEALKVTVQQHRARVMELQGTESGLRSQLSVYTDKYDEFQNALVKSNQVFGGFKEEMEKMSKKIKKLEKESLSWKKRWETSQTALLDMCGERQASEERAAAQARQLHNMQSLCRTMQAERTLLLSTLKEHNIERPPLPAPAPAPAPAPPAPAPQPASNAKVDAMAANCAQLRQSLAHLQSQLNVLTSKQPAAAEEPPKPEKAKKSKSKKSKKQEVKESESDSNAKESAESAPEDKSKAKEETDAIQEKVAAVLNTATAIADKVEDIRDNDNAEEKVDDKTLESLIQAINNANINLCDLEVVGDDKVDVSDVLDVDSIPKDDDITKSTDTASNASEIETSNKNSSNEESPLNGPKVTDVVEDITNGVNLVVVRDDEVTGIDFMDLFPRESTSRAKIIELTDEDIDNRPKIVDLTDEDICNRPNIVELLHEELVKTPKIIELPDDTPIRIPKDVKQAANSEIKSKVAQSDA